MQIKKYKPCGKWIYGEYDFYVGNQIVAKFRTQLIGVDYVYLYFLPKIYGDSYSIRIDIRYITIKEALEKATKIVQSKLYTIASDILSDIKHIEIEH